MFDPIDAPNPPTGPTADPPAEPTDPATVSMPPPADTAVAAAGPPAVEPGGSGAEPPRLRTAVAGSTVFFARADGLWMTAPDRHGKVVTTQLSTVDAEVLAQIIYHDDAETVAMERVAVRRAGRETVDTATPKDVRIRPADLIRRVAGPAAIMPYPASNRLLGEAISRLSAAELPVEHVYRCLGWVRTDAGWIYRHAGGGIGPSGPDRTIRVDMDAPLDTFELPEPTAGRQLRDAVRTALTILDLMPDAVGVVLLGAAWRAPIGGAEWSVFVFGPSGAGKSTITALGQGFAAPTARHDNLPAGFASTPGAIAELQYLAADTLLVVDDLSSDSADLAGSVDRVVRGAANHAGRGRVRPDGTLRPPRPPRCLTVITGEVLPAGRSFRARLIPVAVSHGALTLGADLDDAQSAAASGVYAGVTAAWVAHIAAVGVDTVRGRLDAAAKNIVRAKTAPGGHPRSAANLADLAAVWSLWLGWAEGAGAITPVERAALAGRVRGGIAELERQTEAVLRSGGEDSQSPALRCLRLLGYAIGEGRCRLADARTGDDSPDGLPVIGWTSTDQAGVVMLDPELAVSAAQREAAIRGEAYAATVAAVGRDLVDASMLVVHDAGRATSRQQVGAGRRRVWAVSRGALPATSAAPDPLGRAEKAGGRLRDVS